MDQVLLRVEDVRRVLRIGRSQAYALCASGQLPVVRIGRSVRVPAEDLHAWVRAQTKQQEAGGGEAA